MKLRKNPFVMGILSFRCIGAFVCAIVFFTNCNTPQSIQVSPSSADSGNTAARRWNLPETGVGNSDGTDTFIIRKSSYIPIEGRMLAAPDLEGTWELETINGKKIAERSNFKKEVISKVAKEAAKAKSGNQTFSDTVVSKNGTETTISTIFYQKDSSIRITPPQGGDYHIPEKPSLRFYGLNETFSGFTGCNKISGRYTTADTASINFNHASPSTRMVCMGDYDEELFVIALNSVNSYKVTKNQLFLLKGDEVVLMFRRID